MAREYFIAGDKIVFGRCKKNKGILGVTIGKIYKVIDVAGDLLFIDDDGDYNYILCCLNGGGKATRIIKSV